MAKGEKKVEGGSVAAAGDGAAPSSSAGAGALGKAIAQLNVWTVGKYRRNIGVAFLYGNHNVNVFLNANSLDGKLHLRPRTEKDQEAA